MTQAMLEAAKVLCEGSHPVISGVWTVAECVLAITSSGYF